MKCVLAKRNAGLTAGGYKVRLVAYNIYHSRDREDLVIGIRVLLKQRFVFLFQYCGHTQPATIHLMTFHSLKPKQNNKTGPTATIFNIIL